jgi:hypothetical protein
MLAKSSKDTASAMSITRRRGSRSTHAPAGRPISTHGSHAAATNRPTTNAPACSDTTATSGTATAETVLPSLLTVSPTQKWRRSRLISTPGQSREAVARSDRGFTRFRVVPARRMRT